MSGSPAPASPQQHPHEQLLQIALDHHRRGLLQQAEHFYRQILAQNPSDPEALHLLGVLAKQAGHPGDAVALIQRSIQLGADRFDTWNNLGEALTAADRRAEAIQAYRNAILRNPLVADVYNNLGVVFHELHRFGQAQAAQQLALRLNPNLAVAYTGLAAIAQDTSRPDEALALFRRALELDPSRAENHSNLGSALEHAGDLRGAEQCYRRAIELRPNLWEAVNNLGAILHKLNRRDEAVRIWQTVPASVPASTDARWNLGLSHLSTGDFQRGWPLYELRRTQPLYDHHTYDKPLWTGEDIAGKTILLHAEQGFGDVLQFARFIPLLAARDARIILHCHAELTELIKTVSGITQVVSTAEPLPMFDVYLSLLSVPLLLGIPFNALPGEVPYLHAPPDRREHFAPRIDATTPPNKQLRIGLVWAGKTVPDPRRTIPLADLAPLAEIPGIAFFSLQKGPAAEQLASSPLHAKTIDLAPGLSDFADTAAAMECLDLVLTIDTAAAHLAGALGVETWTLLPFSPDWRWMTDRDDSPWYPTMRLFRQSALDDWSAPMEHISRALKEMLKRQRKNKGDGTTDKHR